MKAFLIGLVLAGLAGAASAQDATPDTETGGAGSWGAAAPDTGPDTGPDTAANAEDAAPGFTPEPQVATGRFTTALEIKPILAATQGNWIAVREYDGQDLLYFTHLLAWRCGLHQIRYAVNDGDEQVFPAEPCYLGSNAPNAIKADSVLPYLAFPLGSVAAVRVHLVYDDGSEQAVDFARPAILMP